jgi:hypothetical protein
MKPALAQALEQRALRPLAVAHERREHHDRFAAELGQHLLDDALAGLRREQVPAARAVRASGACEQHAEVVVDLGQRADRRARSAALALLVDRDRRREPLDGLDVGLLHAPEELARVGREGLEKAPLPLAEERVERERRLAGPGDPRDRHEGVARDVDVDRAQVVLARLADTDGAAPRRRGHRVPAPPARTRAGSREGPFRASCGMRSMGPTSLRARLPDAAS